ncbi:OLC1v1021433C1 [Oldenlandia corymbosa var. corymbosa]|uniref:Homeobox-leucine zipper protein n=1 Tax=Oldenlandia corymbosa var. corymbosa TaxID=529605 RepID=A0AAV1BVM3_OLDCO|nr:OLC1v1021433C1 [Oldenlandia corymbosa var. corymbosa]
MERKQQNEVLKHHKKRLTQDQVKLLQSSFDFNNKLDPDRKLQLAQELGIPPRKISIWYQNKRARWKTESLEADSKALKLRLETLLDDNQRLQSEVGRLRLELHRAREMLSSANKYSAFSSQLSSSCDEVGSSSLIHDHRHHSSKHHLDKVDLFACLIGGSTGHQGQFGSSASDHEFFPPSLS